MTITGFTWQLRGLCERYGVYLADTGLRGSYGVSVAVTGSAWKLRGLCGSYESMWQLRGLRGSYGSS